MVLHCFLGAHGNKERGKKPGIFVGLHSLCSWNCLFIRFVESRSFTIAWCSLIFFSVMHGPWAPIDFCEEEISSLIYIRFFAWNQAVHTLQHLSVIGLWRLVWNGLGGDGNRFISKGRITNDSRWWEHNYTITRPIPKSLPDMTTDLEWLSELNPVAPTLYLLLSNGLAFYRFLTSISWIP